VALPVLRRRGARLVPRVRGIQHHIKLSFFKGARLQPPPPVGKVKAVRSLDVREQDELAERQLAAWIKQAAALPGWDGGSPSNGGTPE
jgi:hypothetical protein